MTFPITPNPIPNKRKEMHINLNASVHHTHQFASAQDSLRGLYIMRELILIGNREDGYKAGAIGVKKRYKGKE